MFDSKHVKSIWQPRMGNSERLATLGTKHRAEKKKKKQQNTEN
jgi:hypothetical protein